MTTAAENLVRAWGTRDPFRLCEALGIAVVRVDLPDATRGLYYRCGGKSIILLADRLPPAESRAVCAHELGHALLHPQLNVQFMLQNTRLVTARLEREADRFAAELLIDPAVWQDAQYEGYSREQLAAALELPPRLLEAIRPGNEPC